MVVVVVEAVAAVVVGGGGGGAGAIALKVKSYKTITTKNLRAHVMHFKPFLQRAAAARPCNTTALSAVQERE